MSLTIEHLFKRYHSFFNRNQYIVEDLSLTIEDGQVYALIGQNGVGKTTTIKCILKYIKMDKGKVLVDNEDIENLMTNNKVGYSPENLIFPSIISLEEFLYDLCILRGMKKDFAKERIHELSKRFNLDHVLDKNINKFSKGMKRKVSFIQAIINDPKVLILDEPTDGLDPISRKEVLTTIREIADKGNLILITSHILSDLNLISDKVGLMNNGQLISEIIPRTYLKNKNPKITLQVEKNASTETQIYDLEPSIEIDVKDADRCIIKDIFVGDLDLEDWYYKELLEKGAVKCGR